MAPTRWGIVSTGKIAFDFTNALSLLPAENHKVAAVAARALPRAQQFAKDFNIPKAYGSYKELSEDPDIDVIYVGTIHPTHFDVCKLMIEAGKNVLCEKPLTMNLKQAKAIIALAKEKKVFFMEGYWSRFFPVYHDVRQALARGDIGEVKFVQVDFGFDMVTHNWIGEGWDGLMPTIGGYPVQIAMMVFQGEVPLKIEASGKIQDGYDRSLFMKLHFSNDRVAQLTAHAEVLLSQTARIYGSKGTIEIPNFWAPDEVVIAGKTSKHPLPVGTKPMNCIRSEGFVHEANAVRESILKGETESPFLTLEDSLRIMAITDEVRRQIGVVYAEDTDWTEK